MVQNFRHGTGVQGESGGRIDGHKPQWQESSCHRRGEPVSGFLILLEDGREVHKQWKCGRAGEVFPAPPCFLSPCIGTSALHRSGMCLRYIQLINDTPANSVGVQTRKTRAPVSLLSLPIHNADKYTRKDVHD